jgi:CheY-like chemotaxis protein
VKREETELTSYRINLRHLAKNLETLGYQYILCNNGKEALDSFTQPDSDIDAVIIVSIYH